MDDHVEKLKAYIKQQLQTGVESNDIAAQLVNANHDPNLVKQSIEAVLAEMKPIIPDKPAQPAHQPSGTFEFQPPRPATMQPGLSTVRRGRLKTGWLLFKQSLRVFNGNRYLLRYMFMTYLSVMLITIGFVALYLAGHWMIWNKSVDNNGLTTLFGFGVMFINYVMVYFAINFYAAGLTANILDIYSGNKQPYYVYIQAARKKAMPLFVLSVFSATIGVILRYIAERLGWIGRLIEFVLGTVWSIATMFTIPLLITSDVSAPGAVKGSVKLLKNTWGESISAKVSVNFPLFLINVAFSFIAWASIQLLGLSLGSLGIIIIWLIIYVAIEIAIAIVGSFANTLVNTAVFYYASYHLVPAAFDEELLNQVFIARKRRFFGKNKQ